MRTMIDDVREQVKQYTPQVISACAGVDVSDNGGSIPCPLHNGKDSNFSVYNNGGR